MKKMHSQGRLSRRKVLKIAAGVTGGAIVGSVLFEMSPWLDLNAQLRDVRKLPRMDLDGNAQLREIVKCATLGASGHNAQPWIFKVNNRGIEIHPDLSRRLPAVDPNDRELWISLGCALENLCLAARAAGYEPEIGYPEGDDWILIDFARRKRAEPPLFASIPTRQNTRSRYDSRKIESMELDKFMSIPLEEGIVVEVIDGKKDMEKVLEYIRSANLVQFADPPFIDELIHWIRFNKRESIASLDGLDSRCMGSPAIPRWLGRQIVGRTTPENQADTDEVMLRSSSGVMAIASHEDSKAAWVRTGQVYQRLALALTSMNIKSAFLNQPIEVPSVRTQFQSELGFGRAMPQLLLRFGYAEPMPQSLRRPVDDVIQWT